ncbi:MAG: undecaprenyl-diphosphate phosphatase [Clostridia bacterium]|nr:undecaprenyl-diphosphate phosphatase [Clostridia bacterium]
MAFLILLVEILKTVFMGIIEGITEWLPVSSTGHLILAQEFIKLDTFKNNPAFEELFNVVIQLGAILAVVVLFFDKLNPFSRKKNTAQRKDTWSLWLKVIVAVIPAAVIGLLLDDWFEEKFYNFISVSIALIAYGILFIIVERINKRRKMQYNTVYDIDMKTAFKIGCFQVLSLVPGTSRSGSTILGASVIKVSREAAAEFSFFLAIPVMVGASLFKGLKYFVNVGMPSATELLVLYVGTLASFLVSLLVIKFLMSFVKKHSFESFGWYRIILGVILVLYYVCAK